MTDEQPHQIAPDPPLSSRPVPDRPPAAADVRARGPEHRGAGLDPERGPGLGCFWFQAIVLGFFMVLVPIGLSLDWPVELVAILVTFDIGLLLLTGQSVVFLLRLAVADRRARGRLRPPTRATKTAGDLEDRSRAAQAAGTGPAGRARRVGGARPVGDAPAPPPMVRGDGVAATPTGEAIAADPGRDPAADDLEEPATESTTAADVPAGAVDPEEPAAGALEEPVDDAPAPVGPPVDDAGPPADDARASADDARASADDARASADDARPGASPEEPGPGVRQ